MTIHYSSLLDAFNTSHLIFISSLVGYLLASPASLRIWLAAQKAPVVQLVEAKDESMTRLATVIMVASLLAAVGLEYTLFAYASVKTISVIFTGLYGFLCGIATEALFGNLTSFTQRSVNRNTRGVPTLLPVKQTNSKKRTATEIGIFLSALAVTTSAFLIEHRIFIGIVSTALVYKWSRHVELKTISMRGMITAFLRFIGGLLLFTALLAFYFLGKSQSGSPPKSSPSEDTGSSVSLALKVLIRERAWLFAPMYAPFPGWLIALSLRFDYQRHIDSSEAPCEFILSTVPAPEPKAGNEKMYGDGIVIPSKAPVAFSKVYYITALTAWGLGWFTLTCISAFTPLSFENTYEFNAIALLFEIPIMCFSLMAVATIRGEWKAMWTYREVWTVKAVPGTILASDSQETQPNLLEKGRKEATDVNQVETVL